MKFNKLLARGFLNIVRFSKCVFLLFMMTFATVPLFSQNMENIIVSGVVTDHSTGEPLVGVTIVVKNSTQATVTNPEGKYSIKVEKGKTLVFSNISFVSQEVQVTKSNIDVSLVENTEVLNEVVVVGYGTMKRSDLTGSVVSVSADDIKKTVSTSLDQALQGRAAGVQVTQNSGAPGGGISVSIRGINSLTGNEPLYIIDGIAIEGQTNGNSNALSAINPSDITSMEVLKDASATAIYGSRASNGVVLITTRRGQVGKTKVSYEGYYGLQQLPRKLEVLNLREYAEYQNLRAEIFGFGAREEFMDPSVLGEGTDWQGEIFRTAPMYNHQLSLSGGSDNTKFAISAGYQNQDGIALGSGFERLSTRVNLDTRVAKWFDVGFNSAISRFKRTNTIDNSGIISTAIKQMPDTPARNPDGTFGTQQENMYGTYFSNPLADALMNENYDKETQMQLNAFANFNLQKGLSVRVEYGGSFTYANHYQYIPTYDTGLSVQNSSGSRTASNGSYTTFKTYLTYANTFGKHSLNVMAGHEAQENSWESLFGSRTNYFFNNVHELGAGDSQTAKNGSSRNSSAIESYYGRLNYSFDDRYLLTATIRADGSSSFGPNNRWGYFPSVALAWKIKNERFLKEVSAISNLKIRLGWGLVGNQWAGSYAYGASMVSSPGVWGTGFYAGNYPNDNLKWEETSSYNAGLDLALFDNRIEFIADVYHKKTDNLLMRASLPEYVSGVITSPYVNAGSMENKGLEFTLNSVNINSKEFLWKTGLTFSLNRNEVLELYTETAGIQGKINGQQFTYTQVGNPAGQFYGYKVNGMFYNEADFYLRDKNGDFLYDETGAKRQVAIPEGKSISEAEVWYGDFIFEDINEDGVIDEKDRTYIGNPEPKFGYGITNTFSYKGFDLNIFLNGVYGNEVYNYLRQEYTKPGQNSNLLKEATEIARVELIDPNGDRTLENMHVVNASTARVQRLYTSDANVNNRVSDRFVEDGSYLRIKNISLGYTLPKVIVSRIGLENVRVYCNIQNLWTITGYSGYDPEVGAYNQDVLTRGIDYARYPSQRTYTFGLNLNF